MGIGSKLHQGHTQWIEAGPSCSRMRLPFHGRPLKRSPSLCPGRRAVVTQCSSVPSWSCLRPGAVKRTIGTTLFYNVAQHSGTDRGTGRKGIGHKGTEYKGIDHKNTQYKGSGYACRLDRCGEA